MIIFLLIRNRIENIQTVSKSSISSIVRFFPFRRKIRLILMKREVPIVFLVDVIELFYRIKFRWKKNQIIRMFAIKKIKYRYHCIHQYIGRWWKLAVRSMRQWSISNSFVSRYNLDRFQSRSIRSHSNRFDTLRKSSSHWYRMDRWFSRRSPPYGWRFFYQQNLSLVHWSRNVPYLSRVMISIDYLWLKILVKKRAQSQ